MAKMKLQLGSYGKAFLLAEQAMSTLEKDLIDRLKQRDSKIEDAMLLINGYLILAKSYEFSSDYDIQYIQSKSVWAQRNQQDQFCKFYLNAKQLAIKYLGNNNKLIQKLQYSCSHRVQNPKTPQPIPQLISRQQLNQLIQLLKLVKGRVIIVIQPEKPLIRRCLKGSIDTHKTTSTQNSQVDMSKPYIKQFRVRCKQNSHHEINSSDETTKEKMQNCDTPISQYKQLETIIQKKVEEQLTMKLNAKQQNNLEEQKKLQEQNQQISNLYDQIQQLKEQLKQKEVLQEQQKVQIELLQAHNKQQLLKNAKSIQSPIKKNNFIKEFQISSEQKQSLVQSAIQIKRAEINEFNTEQTPIKLVNSIIGEFQTPGNKSSIAEFQTNKKSTPPFSFSFHKNQQQSIDVPLTPPPNVTQDNTLDQSQQWPSQKLQYISIIEFEESMNFSITYCKIQLGTLFHLIITQ
ncbi:unnamed protein product (macronuclear) [Paramecium tetraurelia]|uniref:Uncharacterized protein n=1 Tax=Paramecium tetraurelia TaxID=5888 RepID=A0CHB5_PARTE|nr:uncharacterized protein GSPATT00038284001 [Paramecium tetraurelia]CAK70182.1 unnamed protein product [Paramecium tetraurelia]|eukprot:XP_001437579.1 hypothetical protein (macronuclear) [Paramecium tetraurelia strain d4-2]